MAKALQPGSKHNVRKFESSAGWWNRFLNRDRFTIRQKTHIAQKLPKNIDGEVFLFYQICTKLKKNV